jgi:hypothetical protein
MKRNLIMSATAVTALAVILFIGCRQRNQRGYYSQKETEIHIPAPIDTSAMDEEFYRRMREFEALHPDAPLDR